MSLLTFIAGVVASMQVAAGCDMQAAQSAFGQTPRRDAEIVAMLDRCERQGVADFRIPLFRGVMARDAGDLPASREFLGRARAAAPEVAITTLELALTEERLVDLDRAADLYRDVLRADPASRPAQLGLARLARAQGRDADAAAIYRDLLQRDAGDIDAANGLGWLDLGADRPRQASERFNRVLAQSPGNADALLGLDQSRRRSPTVVRLEVMGGRVRTDVGSAWTRNAMMSAWMPDGRWIEAGLGGASREIPAATPADLSFLPSQSVHLGFGHSLPEKVNWAVEYDYRGYDALPDQHLARLEVGMPIRGRARIFVAVRQSFGSDVFRDRVLSVGAVAPLGQNWEVVATVYNGRHRRPDGLGQYGVIGSGITGGLDINRQGPGISFLNFGVSYNEKIDSLDLHGRAAIPLNDNLALTLSAQRVTLLDEVEGGIGLQYYWK